MTVLLMTPTYLVIKSDGLSIVTTHPKLLACLSPLVRALSILGIMPKSLLVSRLQASKCSNSQKASPLAPP